MARQPKISKSNFIKGKQCLKALYLNKYHYEKRDPVSKELQARFDRGHDVGNMAHQLFPGGKMAAFKLPQGFWKSINYTKELIDKGEIIIYEAGLLYKNTHCFVDIMVKKDEKWLMYEVKSSGSITDTYIYDAAFQYYVARNLGLKIDDVSIVYVNREYEQKEELDVRNYFIVESVFDKVKELQPYVEEQLQTETKILSLEEIPKIEMGEYCNYPYKCDFLGYCKSDQKNILTVNQE